MTMPAIWLREADVRSLVRVTDAIDVLRQAFRDEADGEAHVLPRWRGFGPHGQGQYNVMAASLPRRGVCGLKCYPVFEGAGAWHLLLYAWEPPRLLAICEADILGRIRTGAASGLATDLLARPDARVFACIGSGRQAETQVEAVRAVRPGLTEIRVYSRTPERARAFADRIGGRAVATAEEAVRGADIVTTITNARQPVVRGEWLAPGCHVNAAGSNAADRAELDAAAVAAASVIFTDNVAGARLECGDLLQAGVDWSRVQPLAALVAGQAAGRTSESCITLFESQGIALEDVALAHLAWQRAVAQGVGTPLPV